MNTGGKRQQEFKNHHGKCFGRNCRGAEEHIPERSPAVDQYQASYYDITARSSACALNTSTRRQMQLQLSDTTSEEDNDDMAPDAADDDDDDAANSNKTSVEDNIARTEKYLRLYF